MKKNQTLTCNIATALTSLCTRWRGTTCRHGYISPSVCKQQRDSEPLVSTPLRFPPRVLQSVTPPAGNLTSKHRPPLTFDPAYLGGSVRQTNDTTKSGSWCISEEEEKQMSQIEGDRCSQKKKNKGKKCVLTPFLCAFACFPSQIRLRLQPDFCRTVRRSACLKRSRKSFSKSRRRKRTKRYIFLKKRRAELRSSRKKSLFTLSSHVEWPTQSITGKR